MEVRTERRKTGEFQLGPSKLSPAAIASALELQHAIAEKTGRWLRVGEVLLLRGDLSSDNVQQLRGTALFPVLGTTLPGAELYGEIALRKGFLRPEQFLQCLEHQSTDRREKKPHKLIGTILVEHGFLKPKQLEACEEEFRRDLRLHHDEAKRASEAAEESEKPTLTPIDAQYVRAARAGELPTEDVVSALGTWRKLQKLLDRRVALWEYLVVRGIVPLEMHLRMLEKSCNIKSAHFGSWMLGGVLVELGYASAQDVAAALEAKTAEGPKGRRLGDILLERKIVSPAELEEALRVQALRRRAERRPTVAESMQSPRARRAGFVALGLGVIFVLGFIAGSLRTSLAYRTLADPGAPIGSRLAALERLAAREGRAADEAILAAALRREAPAPLRAAAILALEESPLRAARDLVASALREETPAVRAAAAWVAAPRRDRALEPALRSCLAGKDPPIALAAARALALLSEADGRDALVLALEPKHAESRRLADLLGRGEGEVRRAVIHALEHLSGFRFGDRVDRWEAWLALEPAADQAVGRHRGPATVARLARLLDSPRVSARFAAARGLAHMGDLRGARLLVAALGGEDATLRSALKTERDIDVEKLVPEIVALLELATGERHGADAAAWEAVVSRLEAEAARTARGAGAAAPDGVAPDASLSPAPGSGGASR
jgi:HEAT repeat protein